MTYVHDAVDAAPAPDTAAPQVETAPARWNLATRIAFRFFALYFGFYILLTQMFNSLVPMSWAPNPEASWTVRTVVTWVAANVLGFPPLYQGPSGSGDKPYDYAFVFTFLVIAAAFTAIWSIADRRRPAYPGLHKWYRVFLRWGLGATMLVYGTIKAIPTQMPYPSLSRLLEPYGHFSLMGVVWAQIGASPAYQIFIGTMEVICALLLFIPGLTTVGAMLTLITSVQIFVVNMTYDVPVKLFSFHLILMSLMLLAPDMKRLARVMFRRGVDAAPEPPLIRNRRGRQAFVAAQLLFGGWLVYSGFSGVMESRRTFGADAPKPALYGIWEIERMTIDGVERAPLTTDYERWRRIVIQTASQIRFQRMDDTFQTFAATFDEAAGRITFKRGQPPHQTDIGGFTFERPSPDRLIVDGTLQNRRLRLESRLVDHTQFQLWKSGFRWMQDLPFNR